MGFDADDAQHYNPGSQKNEAEQPSCNIEGGYDARSQIELMHNEAEDGPNDGSREQRPELHGKQNELIQKTSADSARNPLASGMPRTMAGVLLGSQMRFCSELSSGDP